MRQPTASSSASQPGGTTRGRAAFLDQRRALHRLAGRQAVAVEYGHLMLAAIEHDSACAGGGRLERSAGLVDRRKLPACPRDPTPPGDSSRSRSWRRWPLRSGPRRRRRRRARSARCCRHPSPPARTARTTGRRTACRGWRRTAGGRAGSRRRPARPRRPASAPAAPTCTSPIEVFAVAETRVRTKSRRTSAISSPSAEKLPGSGGTTTVRMPSSSATAAACNGPAPPNGNRAKSRGSMPRITDTSLIAPARDTAAIRKMPSAIATGLSRTCVASLVMAASAASRSSTISPPSGRSTPRRPSTTLASVMVGSRPPRP